MILYDKTKDPAHCCGCGGCGEICHTKAITFHEDAEGFSYPSIEPADCTDCGMCDRICPIEHPAPSSRRSAVEQQAYAVLHKDRDVVKESSSGGVFSALAKSVLENGGHVFGAAFQDDLSVKHVRIDSWSDIAKLRLSKYVQSDIGDTYLQARQLLRDGKVVYFTGVPCQIAGLNRYLMKDYPNLLTSEVLCHGIPSTKVWFKYLDHLRRPLHHVRMRAADTWGESMVFSRRPDGRGRTTLHWMVSPYLYAFMENLLHRPVCYTCPFAGTVREADITLGDYWGVRQRHPEIPSKLGVSLVLVNTDNGEKSFAAISSELHVVPSKVEWAAERNHPLRSPAAPHPRRADFFRELDTLAFSELSRKYMLPPNYRSFLLKQTLKGYVKKTLGILGVHRFKEKVS